MTSVSSLTGYWHTLLQEGKRIYCQSEFWISRSSFEFTLTERMRGLLSRWCLAACVDVLLRGRLAPARWAENKQAVRSHLVSLALDTWTHRRACRPAATSGLCLEAPPPSDSGAAANDGLLFSPGWMWGAAMRWISRQWKKEKEAVSTQEFLKNDR